MLVGLAISAFAGNGYGGGFVSIGGVYALVTLAILIVLVGYIRWDERENGRPSRR